MYAEREVAAPAVLVQNVHNKSLVTPDDILEGLRLLEFTHWDFGGREKQGRIIMHEFAMVATRKYYQTAYDIGFPIHSVQPVNRYNWRDEKSLAANNSSGHNMRLIDDGSGRWSLHAIGCAKDTNPMQNPCFILDEDGRETDRLPPLGTYDLSAPGTLLPDHVLVKIMTDHGFHWGGNWTSPKDYQHFQMDREILPDHLRKYV